MSSKGVSAGRDQYAASRGRAEKPSDAALVRTAMGRGELLHRADHGDKEARDLLVRHGHGDEFDLGGGDAA